MDEAKPLRADARRNREAILTAARRVFEAGDDSLRFDDFAPIAGVGTGTLYRHFPSREALAAAVYREEVEGLRLRADELASSLPGIDAIAAFIRGMIDYLEPRTGLARTLASLMASRSDELAEGGRDLEHAVARLVSAGVEDGSIRLDAEPGAVMIALHGIGATHDRAKWRVEADALADLLVDGLRRRP